jgi:hypothetical protein
MSDYMTLEDREFAGVLARANKAEAERDAAIARAEKAEAELALVIRHTSRALAAADIRIAGLKQSLADLRLYAASVWFDETTATDEEHEMMRRARAALAGTEGNDQ